MKEKQKSFNWIKQSAMTILKLIGFDIIFNLGFLMKNDVSVHKYFNHNVYAPLSNSLNIRIIISKYRYML